MNRYTRSVNGTIPVRGHLYADEELVASQDGVGLYDGKDKSPHHQNGVVHITTHRLFYVDSSNPQAHSLALNLSNVRQTEFYAGFLKSSPKGTLVLGTPADNDEEDEDEGATTAAPAAQPPPPPPSTTTRFFIEAWICPICSFSNPPSANEGRPKCQLCGVTRDPAAVPAANKSIIPPPPPLPAPVAIRPPQEESQLEPSTADPDGSIPCPACTFLNHPSMRLCEICSTPLRVGSRQQQPQQQSGLAAARRPANADPVSTSGAVSRATTPAPGTEAIKISFRKGGEKVWYAALKKTLMGKAWDGSPLDRQPRSAGSPSRTSNVHSGIHGIMQAAESTARAETETLSVSLRDLEALMAKAKQMVQIAQTLNEKLSAQEDAQRALSPSSPPSSSSTAVPEEATFIRSSMARLGLPSVAVTQDMVKDEKEYIDGLARELAGVLTGSGAGKTRGLMGEHNGIMGLDEVWCAWNRARGISLLPPSTLISVIPLLYLYTSPPIHQRTFKQSGLSVLHVPKYAHDAFTTRFLYLISDPEAGGTGLGALSSVEVAREEGMSVGLVEEMIGAVEDDGEVLRDEPGGYEPVRWYPTSQFRNLIAVWDGTQ